MTEPAYRPGAISDVIATKEGLDVRLGSDANEVLSWRWLRDHGEDPTSFDHATGQRQVHAIGPAEPMPALRVTLNRAAPEPRIELEWPEDPTATYISTATIERLLADAGRAGGGRAGDTGYGGPQPSLWHGPESIGVDGGGSGPSQPPLSVAEVLQSDEALAMWLSRIATDGFATLHGFMDLSNSGAGGPVELDRARRAVTELADRIGYVRSSVFGSTWELASDVAGHDSSYSQTYLAPHTDGTYCHDAPGLQMFCCLERSGTGGESILVDGFAVAEALRSQYPDDFALLATVEVPAHYIEPGVELRASRPAIVVDRAGAVRQISMNNYDRSPMWLPPDQMRAFYRAYGRLHDLANDRSRWLTIGLSPGDVLINDNWRILHGRLGYSGSRRLIGCYLNREDFESRLRTVVGTGGASA